MPELPEVETTLRGLAPHLVGQRVVAVAVRNPRLRQPVPADLGARLTGQRLDVIERRAKYLLFRFDRDTLLVHLGMSGSLRLVAHDAPPRNHDHLDLRFDGALTLRLHDPRRFGLAVWAGARPETHPLLAHLGPEPLGEAFSGALLAERAQGRKTSVKAFIMDQSVCVGVGNIYASEALFRAGINPLRAAGRVAAARYDGLAQAIREILAAAIAQGGTTLRDFVHSDGQPGYFQQRLMVYDRAGEPCPVCGTTIRNRAVANRNTFWCPQCQH